MSPNRLSIQDMHYRLQAAISNPIEIDRVVQWNEWYQNAHVSVLFRNIQELAIKGITLPQCLSAIAGEAATPWDSKTLRKQKRELQKHVTARIKSHSHPNHLERIRHKMARWRDPNATGPRDSSACMLIAGPPAWITDRVGRRLQELSLLVPPRVCSAVLHTLWNGWCTAPRFQGRHRSTNHCWLGCAGEAQDSIEHYSRCPIAREVLERKLRISISPRQGLAFVMLCKQCQSDPETLALSALFVYSIYMTTNRYRSTNVCDSTRARECMGQFLMQGCEGHHALGNTLGNRWAKPILQIH